MIVPVPIFNDRQSKLLTNIRVNIAFLIDLFDFDCDLSSDRSEVLAVIEQFYKEMYQSHCDITMKPDDKRDL